jgi:hypothetical protein
MGPAEHEHRFEEKTMKTLWIALIAVFAATTIGLADAEAKRMASGKSVGKQAPSGVMQRDATPASPAGASPAGPTATPSAPAAPSSSGATRGASPAVRASATRSGSGRTTAPRPSAPRACATWN